jgi:hypothetical protein
MAASAAMAGEQNDDQGPERAEKSAIEPGGRARASGRGSGPQAPASPEPATKMPVQAVVDGSEEAGQKLKKLPEPLPGSRNYLKIIVEAPGIEPDQASLRISKKIAHPASTRLDFDSIEPKSFHLDPPVGARSGDRRAT